MKRDKSKLVRKKIRDKRGKWTTVWVKRGDTARRQFRKKTTRNKEWRDYYDSWIENLPWKQRDAIKNYTESKYDTINSIARGKVLGRDRFDELKYYGRNDAKKDIRLISKALNNSTFPKSVMLYRGALDNDGWTKDLEVGDLIQDKGFTSTTKNKAQGEEFAWGGAVISRYIEGKENVQILFEIQAYKGSRGADLLWLSEQPDEDEVLLPRNAKLEVVSIGKVTKGRNYYGGAGEFRAKQTIKLRYKDDEQGVGTKEKSEFQKWRERTRGGTAL